LKLLVEQGIVNVNERDERGATLVHKVAGQGHIEILRWLIEMGASMDLTTQNGETPKDVARRFSQLACLKLLGGDTDMNEPNVQNRSSTDKQRGKINNSKQDECARAKQKFDELEKQLDIAKKNYRQFGGRFDDDHKQEKIEHDALK
jgi:ankyrin repeat domain-containing protein 42